MDGSRGPQRRVHRIEGRLWAAITIEEQRVIDAPPGEVVEPALAVVQVPEGNSHDEIAVLVEELEQLHVLLDLLPLNLLRDAVLVRVVLRQFVAMLAVI